MNYTDPQNWHPAAGLMPLLSASDLDDLANDIRENGLLSPIVLHAGTVLDGRNRALACKRAGVTPHFVTWESNGASPLSWVISLNLRRRHLSDDQRAAISLDAKPLLEAEARQRQQEAGKRFGNGKVAFDETPKAIKPIHVREELANRFDVSQYRVQAVQKIKETDESVFQEVKAGTLSIPDAEKKLGLKERMRGITSSESAEWYTPKRYIEAAREVLGTIELDPASCEDANRIVKADTFFTEEDDGLKKDWSGRVWLNPPYGDIGPKFVARLLHAYEEGDVQEAILLVNNATETKWFRPLFEQTICFSDHRVKFWNETGLGESPAHGSSFVYFGHGKKFAEVFGQFGAVVVPHKQ
jgi:phage N-6-adenine-methyltransferase